ncbi:MAG: 2-C-methyl-D-erythritol 2,4-cyclodiphosphate synthase [Rhabdochlamydiaceae bacterium]|nr:2-C-methyl-D-erythritol 2,4-cyclodiphosphate synthase [Candidatus Amphrikana amoebophyrae]
MYKAGIGQDSHRFLKEKTEKKCTIAGLHFDDANGLDADSDGDVVLHAICNAISSITHVYILGEVAPKLCHNEGITDSSVYLEKALQSLGNKKVVHVAVTIEAKWPRMQNRVLEMRQNVANLMGIQVDAVGLTITSGDELSNFARGDGLQAFAIITTVE